MNNEQLLGKITKLQNFGASTVKALGILLLNPLSAGVFTAILIKNWGGSWLYMWIPAYLILGVIYFVFANLVVGLIVQTVSINSYKKMTESEEQELAFRMIKGIG